MQGQKVQFWKCLAQQNLFSVAAVQLDSEIHAIYAVSKMLGREIRRTKGERRRGERRQKEGEWEQERRKLGRERI